MLIEPMPHGQSGKPLHLHCCDHRNGTPERNATPALQQSFENTKVAKTSRTLLCSMFFRIIKDHHNVIRMFREMSIKIANQTGIIEILYAMSNHLKVVE